MSGLTVVSKRGWLAGALSLACLPAAAQHAGHDMHDMPAPPPAQAQHEQHAQHAQHAQAPLEPVPGVTDADRAAAFPPVDGHPVHGRSVHFLALVDRLEVSEADEGDLLAWDASGWIGTDTDRFWWRSEGEGIDGALEHGQVEAFYGRAIARWWDGVAGVRQDFGEGPSRTYAAIGVVGLAPYKFEVEATAYLGQGGQAGLGVEAEYDTLLTNRLMLQWRAEAEAWGQGDAAVGLGPGLATAEAGFRLRYEVTRRFAPYVGVARERAFGDTAALRRSLGKDTDDTRIIAGVRFWF